MGRQCWRKLLKKAGRKRASQRSPNQQPHLAAGLHFLGLPLVHSVGAGLAFGTPGVLSLPGRELAWSPGAFSGQLCGSSPTSSLIVQGEPVVARDNPGSVNGIYADEALSFMGSLVPPFSQGDLIPRFMNMSEAGAQIMDPDLLA